LAAHILTDPARLFGAIGDLPAGHGHPEAGEDLLRLILMDLQNILLGIVNFYSLVGAGCETAPEREARLARLKILPQGRRGAANSNPAGGR
jgi:hypothetical protein